MRFNPFRTGQGLSTWNGSTGTVISISLNPFRTGRGLSTERMMSNLNGLGVSIPLEQGRVFRQK